MARILLVVGDEDYRTSLRVAFDGADHEVVLPEPEQRALPEYARKGIEVVVTDLRMPGMHGLELISTLRTFSPRPAILAVSAPGERQLAVASALDAWLSLGKPVRSEELVAVLTRVQELVSCRRGLDSVTRMSEGDSDD